MRLLFCTWNYFPAEAGGAEQQARLQAEELVGRGHQVMVVCPRYPGMASGRVGSVWVRRLPVVNRRFLRTATYLPLLALYLLTRLRRFDVVHVHIAALQADVTVAVARLLGRPAYLKVACGGEGGEVSRMRAVAPLVRYFGLRRAERVQALSDEISEELIDIGVPPGRIVRIPNGLDLEQFAEADDPERALLRSGLGLPEDTLVYLYVGRFARYKGVLDLVEAWRLGAPPDAQLVLVGTSQTDAPVGELPTVPGVSIRSWTNRIVDYYRAADVLVLPSHADGMSNVLLEAMACGLPVAATRVASHETVVEHGENGLLFEAGDIAALQRSLVELADTGLRERLGGRARESVRSFAIESVVDEIEQVYESLLSGSRA